MTNEFGLPERTMDDLIRYFKARPVLTHEGIKNSIDKDGKLFYSREVGCE